MIYEAYKLDDFGNDIRFYPVWVSEHSILVSISMGEDQHPEYLKTLTPITHRMAPETSCKWSVTHH
ncbi:hypothetical protein O9993_05960 [Vibrio lentus]|nr:hypothetical protein [Vibrio lentus]